MMLKIALSQIRLEWKIWLSADNLPVKDSLSKDSDEQKKEPFDKKKIFFHHEEDFLMILLSCDSFDILRCKLSPPNGFPLDL